ncbi:hypothetical protein PV10_07134 [Exophiala mesophila]|uniref:Uncharacterized protein n=1 Tax=Exophiala mesophila TaxID=212818 RepID=A0A0D1Z761_EXOME|nr:uncharacterized protein PV10_07134 [Exophiala mesophila]KIV89754.1 hypothetical protein PV10_07134 [Exophiala mesophila]
MPAIRSFLSLSVLAACLAHAVADGHLGGEGGEWGGGPGGSPSGPPGGWQGGQGSGHGSSGWNDWPSGGEHQPPPPHVPDMPVAPITCEPTTIANHITVPPVTVTLTKEGMPPPPPAPVTVTVTSVKEHKITITSVHPTTITAPCTSVSVTTKHVTEWQQAPPGCWCGRPGMPPPNGHDGAPMWPWPAGDAPIFTTHIPDFMPGRSSIPASEAVVTGVTDGPAPPPPAPTSSVK